MTTIARLPAAQAKAKAEREAQRNFTSWKLTIIDAMLSDARISDPHFRIAFRVMQAMNRETRVAFIGDETLCDEVPRTDRWKCGHARKKLAKLGWWTVDPGRAERASRYIFLDDNVNVILDQRTVDRDARAERRKMRRQRDRRRRSRARGDVVATTT